MKRKDPQWKWQEYYKRSNNAKCEGKRVFNSYSEACAFNNRSGRFLRGNKRREHLHVYKCHACKQWHIGHAPAKSVRHKRED